MLRRLWADPPERYPDLTGTTIVYLDQKEWGHLLDGCSSDTSSYSGVFETVSRSIDEGDVIYPFSIENLVETGKHGSRDFRKELFEIIFEVSRNYSVGNFFHVLNYEAKAYLHRQDPDREPIDPKQRVFGKGLLFPHGEFDLKPDDWLTDEQVERLKRVLSSDEVNEHLIRSDGLINLETETDFTEVDEYLENIEEARQSAKDGGLNPDSERHRQDYMVDAFREMMLPRLRYHADDLGLDIVSIITIDGFGADFDEYFSQFPAFYVYGTLAFARDAHLDRDVELNDLWDITSLATATPYADIIVTEQFFGGMLHKYGINDRFDTAVLFDVKELEDELS